MKVERLETAAAGADFGGDKISDEYADKIRELLQGGHLYTHDKRVYVLVDPQDGGDLYGIELRSCLLQSNDSPEDYDELSEYDLAALGDVKPVLL